MTNQTKHRQWLVTLGAFATFFLFGALDNLKGPTIPFIIKGLRINYALMGNILGLEYLGFFVATLLAGVIILRVGLKNTILAAVALLATGLAAAAGMPHYGVWLIAFILLGLGFGALEIAGSNLMVLTFPEHKGKMLNLLNAFHGFGSMLVPLYAGTLLAFQVSWRSVFGLCLIPLLLLGVYLSLIRFPKPESQQTEPLIRLAKTAFAPAMFWHYIAICFYVAAEIGVSAWIVEYATTVKGQPAFYSSVLLSVYFGLITGGRLLGSMIVDRVGHLKIVFWAMVGAVVSLSVGMFGPNPCVLFLAVTGLFFSIIFPTLTASFSNIARPRAAKYFGFLFASAGIGGIIGPCLVGIVGNYLQLTKSILLILVYTLIICFATVRLLCLKTQTVRATKLPAVNQAE